MLTCPGTSANAGGKGFGEVDVVDEEGGEMDLLPVQLLLREGNQPQKFWHVSVQMLHYYSNHCALVAIVYAEGGGGGD